MKLTKDEARILADLVYEGKHKMARNYYGKYREALFEALNKLEEKLNIAGEDKRRKGRKSMNDFTDCQDRFIVASIPTRKS